MSLSNHNTRPLRQLHRASTWLAVMLVVGCARDTNVPGVADVECCLPDDVMTVPGDRAWIDTGIELWAGQAISVVASGQVDVGRHGKLKEDVPREVGPAGTFFFSDRVADESFPLPAAGRGPAPCYCLIGRIGNSEPFFIGARKSWAVPQSGRLYLGVNDFDVSDNEGGFSVRVMATEDVQPMFVEHVVPDAAPGGIPQPNCSVVVFYMDGLRPDVIREMAAMGHVPNIHRHFIEGGAWLSRSFTAFPSDTITSNGTMWTGCFSDRHGLKGQVRFSRRTLHSESYLEPLGPNRSARLLAPQGVDRVLHTAQATSVKLARGEEQGERWKQMQTTGVAPLYQYLRGDGADWATGVLPLMTEVPPILWTRSLTRYLPYLHAHKAWQYIDDANTHYAVRHLLGRKSPATIIWLPETDSVSHKQSRGQFGMTRRTIARADLLIGRVVRELEAQGRLQNTYLMLVSDHGHHGGRLTHLAHFDLANELFYKPRELTSDGRWVGGGWGLSVREHRYWNRHEGDSGRQFLFVDGASDGAARLFLPRGRYDSGDWLGDYRPADLFAYRIADHLPPLNLVESLLTTRAVHSNGAVHHPIDLVLMKLTDHSLLVATIDRGAAVVERHRAENGRWVYRYIPVGELNTTKSGDVVWQPKADPVRDPLELLELISPRALAEFHDEKWWLRLTAATRYPDSVVALARHMLWDENLQYREREYAPDLVITARPGWYFGHRDSPGTMHGYPLQDAMLATWMVSGPNIRRGARIETPCRLVDLTPTILQMVGAAFDESELDGQPLQSIYETSRFAPQFAAQPVYWRDVDLRAWKPLQFSPLPVYERLPFSVNDAANPLDLNNVAYNVIALGDWNIARLLDDLLFPLSAGDGPLLRLVEGADERLRHSRWQAVSDAGESLDFPDVALADYSVTSLGNLKRVDGAVDWLQERTRKIDRQIAKPLGRDMTPIAPYLHGPIDATQASVWELYRYAQRIIVQVLDETILNGIENDTDRAVNTFRVLPAEITVEPQSNSPFAPNGKSLKSGPSLNP